MHSDDPVTDAMRILADDPLGGMFNINNAIERHPLIVAPETLLTDVITLISQFHHRACALDVSDFLPEISEQRRYASCVLVMQDQQLLGIFTERDVVRLTAQAIDFINLTIADVMAYPVKTLPINSLQNIFAVLFMFRRHQIRHLPVVDDQEKLIGVISQESIRHALRPANLLKLRRVSDVMTTHVIQAPINQVVLHLAQSMTTHRISCVVITQLDDEGHSNPVGIVTERDIVQFQALQINLNKTEAQTVMSTPLFLLNPEDSLWVAYQEMERRRVGRLVVSWNWGQNIGLVTQTSLLRVFDPMEMYSVIENLQQTIQQLMAERASDKMA